VQSLHINSKKLLKILNDKFKDINFAGFELIILYNSNNKDENKNLEKEVNFDKSEKLENNFNKINNKEEIYKNEEIAKPNFSENFFTLKIEFPIKSDKAVENTINNKLYSLKNKINI